MANKKISQLDAASAVNSDAVFPLSQLVNNNETTQKGTVEQIGSYIAETQTHSSLNTTSKKIVGAINELSDDKADETDLASIHITGSTNNTGSTIEAGKFFYLNGVVCRAKEDIGNGATFTSTNYESISSGITNEFAGYEIRTVTISDTSPINIASKTGYKVTLSNFVSACGIGCIAIPYYHTTYNSIYVRLFDYNLNPITTSNEVKIWYRGKA